MIKSKAPHKIFEPDRAYRINDFDRDPNHPESKAPHQIFESDRAYRINDFCRISRQSESGKVPMAKSAIYKAIKEGTFPAPTKLGTRTAVWFGRQLNQWLEKKFYQSGNAAKRGRT